MGYGVSVVVQEQASALVRAGWLVDVFCLKDDGVKPVPGVCVKEVSTNLVGLRTRLEWGGYRIVVAHTWPFYRLLPKLRGVFRIAWEHGAPPARLFPGQEEFRRSFSAGNLEEVYPNVERVVAISGYIRKEIGWERATVIHNGSDHLWKHRETPGDKPAGAVLRILMVSRLWESERIYKGIEDLVELAKALPSSHEVVLAGRGGEDDAAYLRGRGLKVELNPSDWELCQLYESTDLVVSLSRWEGFNLPLVEAGFFGKPAYALDLCAHPEVTPFVFPDVAAMREKILSIDREGLRAEGVIMNEHVQRFSWEAHARRFVELVEEAPQPGDQGSGAVLACRFIESIWMAHLRLRAAAKSMRDKLKGRGP